MPDYSNGKIYKLVSNQTDKIYIGSTTMNLSWRKGGHKADYKKHLKGKGDFYTSFELMKYDDVDIVLLEDFKCDNKDQLHARERKWIESMDCVNKVRPIITKKERKEYKKDYDVKYREDNNDKINDKRKCECGGKYTARHKTEHLQSMKHKKYVESNGKKQ